MVAPTVAAAAATNVAQFHMINDEDSTTVAEAAKYQIVQLQYNGPSTKTLVDQIHADDPGVIVLMYADPTGEGGFTVGSPSNGCVTSAQASSGGDAWLLYDGTSQISDTTNLGDSSFDNTCISNAMSQAKSADFDGVFWDQMNAVPGYTLSNTCINAYQASSCSTFDGGSESAWQNSMYTFIQDVGSYDSSMGMKSILNIGGTYDQPAVWQQWNGPVSGAMEESFVGSYTGGSVPYDQWQGELANEQWSEANGKYEMAVHYDPGQDQESLDTYGLASMLLNAGGMTSYSSTVPTLNDATYTWWAEYTAAQDLGAPSGAYTTVASGGATVYERKFANGIVVVNPTSSGSQSVALGATYSGSGNEPTSASSVTLAAQSGMILTGSDGTTTTTPPSSGSSTSPTTTTKSKTGSSGSGAAKSSGSGSGKGNGAVAATLPKVSSRSNLSCKYKVDRRDLVLTCKTKAGTKVKWLRLRAYHGGHRIAKDVARVHHHHAAFGVELSKHRKGTYRLVVSIKGHGKVGKLTGSVRIH